MAALNHHLPSLHSLNIDSPIYIWTLQGDLIFSWHASEHLTTTYKTLYRWLDLLIEQECEEEGASFSYGIFPVEVSRNADGPLGHVVEHTSSPISPLERNEQLLTAGSYALGSSDGSILYLKYQFMRSPELILREAMIKQSRLSTALILEPLRTKVRERNQLVCSFTGATLRGSGLDVHWIMPPYLAYMMPEYINKRFETARLIETSPEERSNIMAPMCVLRNCLHMSRGVSKAFQGQRICVDVDDNYRIIRFDEDGMSQRKHPLRTHLLRDGHPDQAGDEFLRAHFAWTLATQIIGGGIPDDFSLNPITRFMVKKGTYPQDQPDDTAGEHGQDNAPNSMVQRVPLPGFTTSVFPDVAWAAILDQSVKMWSYEGLLTWANVGPPEDGEFDEFDE